MWNISVCPYPFCKSRRGNFHYSFFDFKQPWEALCDCVQGQGNLLISVSAIVVLMSPVKILWSSFELTMNPLGTVQCGVQHMHSISVWLVFVLHLTQMKRSMQWSVLLLGQLSSHAVSRSCQYMLSMSNFAWWYGDGTYWALPLYNFYTDVDVISRSRRHQTVSSHWKLYFIVILMD